MVLTLEFLVKDFAAAHHAVFTVLGLLNGKVDSGNNLVHCLRAAFAHGHHTQAAVQAVVNALEMPGLSKTVDDDIHYSVSVFLAARLCDTEHIAVETVDPAGGGQLFQKSGNLLEQAVTGFDAENLVGEFEIPQGKGDDISLFSVPQMHLNHLQKDLSLKGAGELVADQAVALGGEMHQQNAAGAGHTGEDVACKDKLKQDGGQRQHHKGTERCKDQL